MQSPVSILRQLAPKAAPALVAAFGRTFDFQVADVTTPLRLAQFMAQIACETQGFTKLRESGKYSAKRISEVFGVGRHSAAVTPAEAARLAGDERTLFERVYGIGNPSKAKELGNLYSGDGYAYRGGGAMHSTGRNAYTRLGLDENPDLIETAEHCLRGAFDHWTRTGCNRLADLNDIRAITKKVNGGYNGYDDRVAWFNRIWPLLRDGSAAPESWKVAQASETTRVLQTQLRQLGYDIKADGLYGPATTGAIVAFQKANGLKADGIAGDLTTTTIAARIAGTSPATGTVTVSDPPAIAPPVAAGVSTITLAEAGQQIADKADVVNTYAGLSDAVGYFAAGLTAIGVTVIVIGIARTYIIPAIWPARAPVPE
ncbi:peptidoglycan-binding protein [Ancylobacter dichloromethanicus]|uniref:Peptidoglycan binding-like domain-containing protein n=1 Tax=Ancylobacter dichloromethanicus TaxID=518825 RepID=A0A9W6JBZ9_9HYPH|nr:peptidoglycan-binding protein [Ancylobacter dichloromethanicus]GLK74716.1 hypothetical protein GCM10017643_48350 [Ancylobacter dichloromethanicus]